MEKSGPEQAGEKKRIKLEFSEIGTSARISKVHQASRIFWYLFHCNEKFLGFLLSLGETARRAKNVQKPIHKNN